MSDKLNTVLEIIPTLSRAELARVTKAIAVANSLGGGAVLTTDISSDEMWVLNALADYMRGRGVDNSAATALRAQRGYKAFCDKVPDLVAFLARVGPRVKQHALLNVGLELLYDNLTQLGYPVTSRTMMNHAHRIVSMINHEFPGYASQGFLSMIIRGVEKDVRSKRNNRPVPRS